MRGTKHLQRHCPKTQAHREPGAGLKTVNVQGRHSVTAVPLWIAFLLARRRPSRRFTYGYGRVEDLAGVVIVLIILFSAIVAGYEAITRLIHPQPITVLSWVAAAGTIGFLGNEAVAVLRIKVGQRINSAALIADGYHARTDGLTSLAVVSVRSACGLGFPWRTRSSA
jgi:cation diffusion facilitator family transporter